MRRWAALALLLVAACASQEEAQLEQAVREYLSKEKHLELNNISMRLENVEIRDKEAVGTVLYFLGSQPALQYRYTFARDEDGWHVLKSESLAPSTGFFHPPQSEQSPPPGEDEAPGGDEAPPETAEEKAPALPPGHP
jgi:hypothetical protein